MPNTLRSIKRSWPAKFRSAFRGVVEGIRGQTSFLVHFVTAIAIVVAGIVLKVNFVEWCLLALCIAGVLTAELFNSAIELTAKAITSEINPHLRDSLDVASAAVLFASLGAAVVGGIILINRFGILLGLWII